LSDIATCNKILNFWIEATYHRSTVCSDDSATSGWAATNCESGPGKRFGACESVDGVVMQERADEAVLVAVGFDIEAVGPDGNAEVTVVIEVGGDR
jgi:hypothetical protein